MSPSSLLEIVLGSTPISLTNVYVFMFILCIVPFLCFVQNIWLHPLRKFPGPFWGRTTDFYKTYLFSTREFHLRVLCLHQKFGPVVRIAPNLLSISDPFLLPEVYHRHADKTPFYSTGLAGEIAPLLQLQGDREHAAKVKILAPTFSMKNIRLMEDKIDERILKTLETLQFKFAATEKVADLADWIRWYVYDVITYLIYGKPTGMVEESRDVHDLIKSWHDMFRLGGLVATLPWLIHPIISSLPLKKYLMPQKGHKRGSGHIMSIHDSFFEHRLRNPCLAQPGNMFDNFRQTSYANGTPMSIEDAKRECFLSTVAGQDTTAGLISSLVLNILRDPTVHSNLLAEIDTFEQQGQLSLPVARYDETTKMPFFRACVRETLRIAPPTPIILPRYVSHGGMSIHGTWVPEGSEIAANPYIIHRNKEIFGDDADIFRPERWLKPPEQLRLMDKCDLAWGYGNRKCIGKSLALVDSQKFCVQLFRHFHVGSASLIRPAHCENWGVSVYSQQHIRLQEKRRKRLDPARV